MKCLAIDQATLSGWCVGDTNWKPGQWIYGQFRAPARDHDGERFIIIEDTLLGLIDEHKPDVYAFEKPFDPTITNIKKDAPDQQFSQKTMRFLAGVRAAVLMAAARRAYLIVEEYAPQSWQATNLKGVSLDVPRGPKWKSKLVRQVLIRRGFDPGSLDQSDAIGICIHALYGAPAAERAQGDLLARARDQFA